jgi:hypothetical protein
VSNLTRVAGHQLLPHQADWTSRPRYGRQWRTTVEPTLSGRESRAGARPDPWQTLSYSVLPFGHVERARFDDRFRAALKSGRIAVPLWGRGVKLAAAAAAGASALTTARRTDELYTGVYAFLQPQASPSFDDWDLVLLDAVSGTALTLARPLTYAHAAGSYVWPVLFGKPLLRDMSPRSAARTRYEVEVLADRRVVNPTAEDGFEDYEAGVVAGVVAGELDAGSGFAGAWEFAGIV